MKDRRAFEKPEYGELVDPMLLPNMMEAVSRIEKALVEKEKIGIFMDYDADGIPGGAILYKTLISLGAEAVPYVPKREDGYGLNSDAIMLFKQSGVSLLLTVDCGIKNIAEIQSAKEAGIETIVTDHHELGEELPDAVCVHPLIDENNKLKFKMFSGGGVAFLLSKALRGGGREKWLLDLAAISSISDLVPLVEDNRIITRFGLLVLNKTKNLGLEQLINISGLKKGKIGAYEVGYMIAPRINAAGRISHPEKSFRLLTTEDPAEARRVAAELDDLNRERQEILLSAQQEAEDKIEKERLFENNIIILDDSSWPEGIIGLVAGKVSQKYYRPTIVFNEKKEVMKGSARSIKGVNITEFIGRASEHLIGYGGHEQAAGLSLKTKDFSAFKRKIEGLSIDIDKKLFAKTLTVDALLSSKQINFRLAEELELLEPFGSENRRPIFAIEEARVLSIRRIGRDEKHMKIEIEKSAYTHSILAFFFEKNGWKLKAGDICDLAFSIKLGEFNGRKKLDLIVEDIKKHER